MESRSADHLREPEFSQPLVTALQLAILEILNDWGINALAVVGHSSGEIAAAHAAGYLTPRGGYPNCLLPWSGRQGPRGPDRRGPQHDGCWSLAPKRLRRTSRRSATRCRSLATTARAVSRSLVRLRISRRSGPPCREMATSPVFSR